MIATDGIPFWQIPLDWDLPDIFVTQNTSETLGTNFKLQVQVKVQVSAPLRGIRQNGTPSVAIIDGCRSSERPPDKSMTSLCTSGTQSKPLPPHLPPAGHKSGPVQHENKPKMTRCSAYLRLLSAVGVIRAASWDPKCVFLHAINFDATSVGGEPPLNAGDFRGLFQTPYDTRRSAKAVGNITYHTECRIVCSSTKWLKNGGKPNALGRKQSVDLLATVPISIHKYAENRKFSQAVGSSFSPSSMPATTHFRLKTPILDSTDTPGTSPAARKPSGLDTRCPENGHHSTGAAQNGVLEEVKGFDRVWRSQIKGVRLSSLRLREEWKGGKEVVNDPDRSRGRGRAEYRWRPEVSRADGEVARADRSTEGQRPEVVRTEVGGRIGGEPEHSEDLGAAESADSAGLIGIGGGIVGDGTGTEGQRTIRTDRTCGSWKAGKCREHGRNPEGEDRRDRRSTIEEEEDVERGRMMKEATGGGRSIGSGETRKVNRDNRKRRKSRRRSKVDTEAYGGARGRSVLERPKSRKSREGRRRECAWPHGRKLAEKSFVRAPKKVRSGEGRRNESSGLSWDRNQEPEAGAMSDGV
ncbi:hypothetical protein DFH06DRAFT_1122492 [Mycena polygramma]|nr:hypothetical protein DFH06DRAFT_1122492 [Mycena polygramma]